jgi:hypothetical protein
MSGVINKNFKKQMVEAKGQTVSEKMMVTLIQEIESQTKLSQEEV